MQKVISIRVDEDDYRFVKQLASEENEDKSRIIRELLDLGRVLLAIEKYKEGGASLGKASRIAGKSVSEMMDLLAAFGVESNLRYEDYAGGLENLKKVW